ncbi:MAG: HEAT repeat domain-containing protein [Verrucomicrobiales bacterium]|nr:HEAT repeat domain-containing protein [Verrucomicrobiales bacterium]
MSHARPRRPHATLLATALVATGAGIDRPAYPAEHALAAGSAAATAFVAAASPEAEQAIRKFRIPKGWRVDLIAAEPHLANPVAFAFDEQERVYVVETFRHGNGVLDIRGRTDWPSPGYKRLLSPERVAGLADELLDADLACRTVEDREKLLRHYFAENVPSLEALPDRVRRLTRGPDGKVSGATLFADGFQSITDGLASGILARGNDVWFANIPNLWKLRDSDADGVSDERVSLHHGYGVRIGFLGHDLHGLCFGPDGRIYYTIGDRGASVTTREGRRLETPDSGAVFRCEPDGSQLELVATGLRNPQELVFDDLGNLWTGDNNSDGGDQARWTYLVEGADCGWHIGWQFLESPNPRGPWNAEAMWRPGPARAISHIIPALANIGAGPSGITYNFGTGLPAELDRHFFMVDFRGGPSGIWTFSVKPQGAGYTVDEPRELLWNALPTDVELGPDGGLYWSDWVQGWEKTGKGRLYRLYQPETVESPLVKETRELLRASFTARPAADLQRWLAHADQRVRQKAQFALAERGELGVLSAAAAALTAPTPSRLHAIWGLWQIARTSPEALPPLVPLLADANAEVRAQAARVLGDLRHAAAAEALVRQLGDPEPRPRFFAAIALGRLAQPQATPALVTLLATAANQDPFLRHAGVMGLVGCTSPDQLADLATHPSTAVRTAAAVALRRQQSPLLARFLADADPGVVLDAARAIHDLPVPEAMPALAELLSRDSLPTPLLRRVLNANLRAGQPTHATALAQFAARATATEAQRVEALQLLALFPHPPGRDQVTGLWRPLPPRDEPAASAALERIFPALLVAPAEVQVAAARAAGKLASPTLRPALKALATDPRRAGPVRVAALRALAESQAPDVAAVVAALASDSEETVRSEVLRWSARLDPAIALVPIRAALEAGRAPEKQAALAGLAQVQGAEADALLSDWLNRAVAGTAPKEVVLDLIESAHQRPASTVVSALTRLEGTLASTNPVTARRHLLQGGDPEAGRRVFHEKEAVQCLRCHKVGGEGGVVGPDLAGVGSRQTREYLLASIVTPNAAVAAGFENVMLELRDDTELSGTIQKETETELTLNTVENGAVTVKKSEIRDRRQGLSGMPEGLADNLSPRELRDLVEYLQSLRAP